MTGETRSKLLDALSSLEPLDVEASAEAIGKLARAIAALDEEGRKDLSDLGTVLLLAVFPTQPGEPPKPEVMGKCTEHWVRCLRQACAD
jgi:hypothetical protein